MEFVVSVLQDIFGYSEDEAKRIALHAHLNGEAACCICPVGASNDQRWDCEPKALAALRLMTSSNFVGCSTDRSARLAPPEVVLPVSR